MCLILDPLVTFLGFYPIKIPPPNRQPYMYKEVYYTIHCLYLQELEKGLNIQHQEMVKLISARKRQVYVD